MEPCHLSVKNVIFGLTFCFALSAFMRKKENKTFFLGKDFEIPFAFCVIIYCFFTVQPLDDSSAFRWSIICVSAQNSLLGKKNNFRQSPEP